MRVALALFFAFSALTSHADTDPTLVERTEARIRAGVLGCGLSYVAGDDPSLTPPLRGREAEEVIGRTRLGGAFAARMLIDRQTYDDGDRALAYSRPDGTVMMHVLREANDGDLTVTVGRMGTVAYSRTESGGPELATRYYLETDHRGLREVDATGFAEFFEKGLADPLAEWICEHGAE